MKDGDQHKNELNGAVFEYIAQCLKVRQRQHELSIAQKNRDATEEARQNAWRRCVELGVKEKPGIYSFKDQGRNAIGVGSGDYPELTEIVQ